MAETKLTKEQRRIVAKYYEAVGDGMDVEDALAAAINEYASQQQAEHGRALAVLREHEWGYCGKWCNICDSTKKYGHKSDCWLAALLAADKEKGNE